MQRALGMGGRGGEEVLVRLVDAGEEVLRSLPVHLVGVSALEGAADERDFDLLEDLFGRLDGPRAFEREEQGIEHAGVPLATHRQDVVQVHVHHVVGVTHRRFPRGLDRRRQLRRGADVGAQGVEQTDVVGHGLDDASRVLVAEALKAAVAAPAVEREDGLECRVTLSCRPPLLGRERGDAYHAHVAVAPGLLGDPLDGVVVIPVVAHEQFALGLVATAHLADHMHVAVGHEPFGIAAFDDPVPLGGPGRLADLEVLGHLDALQIFVVHGAGIEDRERPSGGRPVDVYAQVDAVTHGDGKVVLLDHAVVVLAVVGHGLLRGSGLERIVTDGHVFGREGHVALLVLDENPFEPADVVARREVLPKLDAPLPGRAVRKSGP